MAPDKVLFLRRCILRSERCCCCCCDNHPTESVVRVLLRWGVEILGVVVVGVFIVIPYELIRRTIDADPNVLDRCGFRFCRDGNGPNRSDVVGVVVGVATGGGSSVELKDTVVVSILLLHGCLSRLPRRRFLLIDCATEPSTCNTVDVVSSGTVVLDVVVVAADRTCPVTAAVDNGRCFLLLLLLHNCDGSVLFGKPMVN
jgi:hypothetical protein